MKVVISLCAFTATILLVAGAPAPEIFVPEPMMYGGFPRIPRSYGAAYAAPCGAGLPLAPAGGYYAPAPAPVHASYGGGYGAAASAGAHGAYAPPSYGYGAPHYRAEEGADTEILNFSDMDQGMSEHHPMARYGGYGGAPAAHVGGVAGLGYGGQLAPAVAAGPAYGVFPNANVGGCNVPLLLSCSPSIVPGRLIKGAAGYGSAGGGAIGYGSGAASVAVGNAYRGADESHHEHDEHSEETISHAVEHTDDPKHTETHN